MHFQGFTVVAAIFGSSPELSEVRHAVGPCRMFPADHIWNVRGDQSPLESRSGEWVADNGSAWNIFGAPDHCRDNDVPNQLKTLRGSHLESVDLSSPM